jgi:hypothetical protein
LIVAQYLNAMAAETRMEGKPRFVVRVVITAHHRFVVSGAVTFINIGARSEFVI